jgi:hypothetical protein
VAVRGWLLGSLKHLHRPITELIADPNVLPQANGVHQSDRCFLRKMTVLASTHDHAQRSLQPRPHLSRFQVGASRATGVEIVNEKPNSPLFDNQ